MAIFVKPQQWPTPSESIAIYCVRKLVSCITHLQSCTKVDIWNKKKKLRTVAKIKPQGYKNWRLPKFSLKKNFLAWKFCIVYCTATGVLIFIELLHFTLAKLDFFPLHVTVCGKPCDRLRQKPRQTRWVILSVRSAEWPSGFVEQCCSRVQWRSYICAKFW